MTNPPTPQGVSAALRKAGFTRSVSSSTAVKGWKNHSPGYVVRQGIKNGTVEVYHETGAFQRDDRDREKRDAKQAEYAQALEAAGYVMSADKSWRGGLIVSARRDG